jgi:hypothetical protein
MIRKFFKKHKFILILIPLGVVIFFINKKLIQDIIINPKIENHLYFISALLLIVFCLLYIILKFDNKSK